MKRTEKAIGLATIRKPNTKRPIGRSRQQRSDRITKDASMLALDNGEELARDRDEWRRLVFVAIKKINEGQ